MFDVKQIEQLLLFNKSNANLRTARSPVHILVIDDDPITCRLVKNIFSEKYSVKTCTDLQEGINEYFRIMPDLVFLDIHLGDKDYNGLDILKMIRNADDKANIVVVTSNDSKENIINSWDYGANGFVTKPFISSHLSSYAEECEKSKNNAGI